MGRVNAIRELVLHGLYYFTDHALAELENDNLDEFDAETVLLHGKIRRLYKKSPAKKEIAHVPLVHFS